MLPLVILPRDYWRSFRLFYHLRLNDIVPVVGYCS